MTFGLGLGAGLRALTAAQLGIQTAGQNVANANTPGYSRQRVLQSAAFPFAIGRGLQVGTGVQVSDVSRIVDGGLERRISLQTSFFGAAQLDVSRLREVEGVFAEPDGGLSVGFSGLFNSIGQLQTDPSDRALRGGVVQSGRALTDSFNLISARLQDLGGNTLSEVVGHVRTVNERASRIAALNAQIISLEANGSTANDLRDTRGQLINEISDLADVRVIERDTGSVDLSIGGRLLVSGSRAGKLRAGTDTNGKTAVFAAGNTRIDIQSGRIGALLDQQGTRIPGLLSNLDTIARNLALEFNRLHTTGVPGSGPFQSLVALNGAPDSDNDGNAADELISQAGFDFDVQAGSVYVSVTDRATGDIERTRIDIDPASTTLQDFADALNAIDTLSATIDPSGRLRIAADSGYGFDFGTRLDAQPDQFGSFGGTAPTLGSSSNGPFDFGTATFPLSFTVDVNGTAETVSLNANEFGDLRNVTAEELAEAINDDLSVATARDVGGRLVIRADSSGSAATLTLTDGANAPLALLGVPTGAVSGRDDGVEVRVSGTYDGDENGQFVFVPDADGEIGVTPGLTVGVYDQAGRRVGTLDVGPGYDGEEIEVADGVRVSFSQGTISAANNEAFAVDTLTDSDTSDILVTLGLNTFFTGGSAADLGVNAALERDPELFAAGLSSAAADGQNLERVTDLRERGLDVLGGTSIESFYTDFVGELGFEVATAETTAAGQQGLLEFLQQERESVSGVNIDEELVDLQRYQQAFEAAARFIDTVQQLSNTLINLGR
jgi:flagellar hook-associated protein FlgK